MLVDPPIIFGLPKDFEAKLAEDSESEDVPELGKEIAQSDFIQIAKEALEFKNKKFPDAKIIINDSIEITRMVKKL